MALGRRSENAPPTPGEVLRKLLHPDVTQDRLTQDRLAGAMGVTRYSINQLVNDRRGVTPEMALRLAKALSTSPQFWLDLQREVDLYEASRRLDATLTKIEVVRAPLTEKELFYDLPA